MGVVSGKRLLELGFPGRINPASVDLSVDIEPTIISTEDRVRRIDGITLTPGDSILLSTKEVVNFAQRNGEPALAGLLVLRTSSFRRGLALASPGWIDPGYVGTLTFRVTNVSNDLVTIKDGEFLVQVVVQEIEGEVEEYSGVYQNSTGVVGYIPH